MSNIMYNTGHGVANKATDEAYTPNYAVYPLLKYIDKSLKTRQRNTKREKELRKLYSKDRNHDKHEKALLVDKDSSLGKMWKDEEDFA